MRKLVVVLVSVVAVAAGRVALHAQDLHAHHYILRAAPTDIDAIAARHSLAIERSDEGPPAIYYAGSNQDAAALKAEVALDTAVLAFEEEQVITLPETTTPTATEPTTSEPTTTTTTSEPTTTTTASEPTTTTTTSEPTTTTTTSEPTTTTTSEPTTTTAPEPTTTTTTSEPTTAPDTTTTEPTTTTTTTEPAPEPTPSPSPDQTTTSSSTETAPATEKPAPTTTITTGSTSTVTAQAPVLPDTTLTNYYSHDVWRGYVFQPAMTNIRAEDAHRDFVTGAGVVAIIDSGIDMQHPAIAGSFVAGFDFRTNQSTITSDLAALSQSTATILEAVGTPDPASLTVAQVNQSTAVILEQSTAVILEAEALPEGVGHGTMVAGLVRLIAPTAKIMPLTVFSATGQGELYDVVRAIYYAVDHGATVINMSFSLEQWSKELIRALNYAAEHNVVCVASAGNGGQETMVFPAGFRGVISVGSINNQNQRSQFSNYGRGLVRLFAPGEGLVTSFPGNRYALVSGTSFSTALVSGAAALLLDWNSNLNPEDVDLAMARVRRRAADGSANPQLRLDLYYALSRVPSSANDR